MSSASPPADPVRAFVLHWNRPVECRRTVAELSAQGIDLRVTIIDNASDPANVQTLLHALPAGIKVIRLQQNLGWGKALNTALEPWVASGSEEFCVIAAHDALPTPKCLEMLLQAMLADSRLGLACPEHVSSEAVRLSAVKGIHLRVIAPRSPGSIEIMPAPHGTLMMMRRECLRQAGLFDERYFAYGDETEIGLRAGAAGWKTGMVWGAQVGNPGTWTPHRLRAYLFARNNILTVRLYLGPLAAFVRAAATLGSCLNPFWWANRGGLGLVAARLRGVLDYFAGRYGPPPTEYFRQE